jgi:preprotein translocase SecE subunit
MAESSIKEKRARRRKRKREARQDTSTETDKGITEKKGTATPGRRTTERSGNAVTNWFSSVRNYLEGVQSELEKVTWPTREETTRLTYIVAAVTLASALVLGGLSILFTELFNIGVDSPLVFLGVFIAFLVLLFGYSRYSSESA